MKLVGGDSGRYEHETFVDEVLLAPSERAIVDVLVRDHGLVHDRAPDAGPHLRVGPSNVSDEPDRRDIAAEFEELRTYPELTAERSGFDTDRAARRPTRRWRSSR